MRLASVAALLSMLLGACGGDDVVGDADTGPADSGALPPDIPWLTDGLPPVALPTLTPCAAGWSEVTDDDDGLTTCEPWPESGPEACAPGEAHFVGEAGCIAVGDACPTGDFADGLPAIDVVYVREGESGGDGSRDTPFGALSEVGWTGLASGTTVALASGSYTGILPLNPGVAVVGACAAETILVGEDLPVAGVVTVRNRGDAATLRNVTMANVPTVAVSVMGALRAVELDGVVIEGATAAGVVIGMGGAVTARELVIRQTRPDSLGQRGGALEVVDGTATIERGVFVENRTAAVVAALAGTEVSLTDVAIRDTRPQEATTTFGRAVVAQLGARVEVTRAVFETHRGSTVFAGGDDAVISLEDVLVRGILPRESDGALGRGLDAEVGGRIEARRVLVDGARDAAVLVAVAPSSAMLEDIIIRDVQGVSSDGRRGTGIIVQQGATADLARIAVEGFRETGILVGRDGARVSMTDIRVRDGLGRMVDGKIGRGLSVQHDAEAQVTRAIFERNRDVNVLAIDGANLVLEDVAVLETREQVCAADTCGDTPLGYGIGSVGATLTATRFVVRSSDVCGAFVATDGVLDLSSGEVTGGAIGACIQVEGYSFDRLTNRVAYRDNGLNLETTMLPVPELAGESPEP